MHGKPYLRLAAMTVLSFISMYLLMYAMVNVLANVMSNLNQVYMAGLMTAPMVVLELLLMGAMYEKRTLNIVIVVLSVLAGLLFWLGIREQIAIGDRQFLRSMIPHHAGAILMCEQAPIESAEVRKLCDQIIASQKTEIATMKRLLGD